MHVQPIVNTVRAALLNSSGISSADPTIEAAVSHLVEALGPALRVAALDLAEQAAGEVRAQLPDHTVDIVLSDGDPTLRITEVGGGPASRSADEDFGARITLRLPPSLKDLIENAAGNTGESVNAWVVEALGKRARGSRRADKSYNQTFDL
jgi:HicB family